MKTNQLFLAGVRFLAKSFLVAFIGIFCGSSMLKESKLFVDVDEAIVSQTTIETVKSFELPKVSNSYTMNQSQNHGVLPQQEVYTCIISNESTMNKPCQKTKRRQNGIQMPSNNFNRTTDVCRLDKPPRGDDILNSS